MKRRDVLRICDLNFEELANTTLSETSELGVALTFTEKVVK